MKWPIIHNECGKIAFYALKDWRLGGLIRGADALLLDGTTPDEHSEMICGSCGKNVMAGAFIFRTCAFGDPIEDH